VASGASPETGERGNDAAQGRDIMTSQPPQDPRQPRPGWYPDPGGQQLLRWWDGRQWATHTQPLPDPQPGAAPYGTGSGHAAQQQPAGNRSRRRSPHRARNILAVIVGLAVAGIIISALSAGSKGTGASPGSTAASAPAPASSAAAAKPAKARTVATFSGSGQENTPRFTVTSTWELDYSFNCASFGYAGNFQVYEDGGKDFNLSVNDLAKGKAGSTWAYNDAGTHYLQINSECSWKVKIVDEP
jgi:hypothetical protein